MVDIDLDLSGVSGLREEINDLRDDWEDNATYVVGTNVEYGVFP